MIHIHMERNGEWRYNSKRFGKHIEPKAADLRFHSSALFIWLVVAVVWSNRLAIYRQLVGPSNQINGGKSCVCVCAVRCRTYFYCHNIACNKQDDTTHYCRCEAFRQHRYLYSIELLYYYCCHFLFQRIMFAIGECECVCTFFLSPAFNQAPFTKALAYQLHIRGRHTHTHIHNNAQ